MLRTCATMASTRDGDRVGRVGHDAGGHAELLRGLGGDRTDRRDGDLLEQVRGLLLAEIGHEMAHARRARERHDVHVAFEQLLVDVGLAFLAPGRAHRPVGGDVVHLGAGLAQLLGERLAGDVGAGQEHALPVEAAGCLQRRDHAFGAILVRHHVDAQVQPLQTLRRCRTDGADAWPVQVADVAHARQRPAHEVVDAVRAGEHEPVIRRRWRRWPGPPRRSRRAVRSGSTALRSPRRRDRVSRSTNSPACSRDRVTTMRVPNRGRSSNQRR